MARPLRAVVPTLGLSPRLTSCLEALRADGGEALEIVVVDQGEEPVALHEGLVDRVLRPGRNEGFAGGTNRGFQASFDDGDPPDFLAAVNDDAVIQPGWTRALRRALEEDPGAAAAQGVNLLGEGGNLVDGAGLDWNCSWQAVQRGYGRSLSELEAELGAGSAPWPVFGVSATAALYRRAALDRVRLQGGAVFDPRLVSYYEDVDLACRLRAAGFHGLLVPAARARHEGSVTGRTLGLGRLRLLHGNRFLVLARMLGRGFWKHLPAILWRDAKDAGAALARGRPGEAAGVLSGLARAARHLPAYAHWGMGPSRESCAEYTRE